MAKKLRLSKSKVGLYDFCNYAYKLANVDKIIVPPNSAMTKGLDVHSFHDKLFDNIVVDGHKLIVGAIDFGLANHDYKRNIIEHYTKKWGLCYARKGCEAEKYFVPFKKEKKIVISDMIDGIVIVGIPDYIIRDFDEQLVIGELKSGKPSSEKCIAYRNDVVWYKLLAEAEYKEPIVNGDIYFPYSNYTYRHELYDVDVTALVNHIEDVATKIKSEKFEPKPSEKNCRWCSFGLWNTDCPKHCEYAVK